MNISFIHRRFGRYTAESGHLLCRICWVLRTTCTKVRLHSQVLSFTLSMLVCFRSLCVVCIKSRRTVTDSTLNVPLVTFLSQRNKQKLDNILGSSKSRCQQEKKQNIRESRITRWAFVNTKSFSQASENGLMEKHKDVTHFLLEVTGSHLSIRCSGLSLVIRRLHCDLCPGSCVSCSKLRGTVPEAVYITFNLSSNNLTSSLIIP